VSQTQSRAVGIRLGARVEKIPHPQDIYRNKSFSSPPGRYFGTILLDDIFGNINIF
jgi:hypothetical protein